jgi:N-acetyl-alpha-D-muramate 1-phosphate uridylyltransferase
MTEPGRVCAVILAAGEGRRLRPLTEEVPKALCPVGNVPLLDLALARLEPLDLCGPRDVAVNAWYLAGQVVDAVGGRAHLSVESGPRPLGTSGGVARLRDWIGGRGVLVVNADAYLSGGDLTPLLSGWDGRTVRLLGVPDERPEFGRHRFAGCSLLPWSRVATLSGEPAELVHTVWRPAEAAGELTVVEYTGTYLDTGTPRDYLAANLHAAAGVTAPSATVAGAALGSVVGPGAVVDGTVESCVVWPHGYVGRDEYLTRAIRYGRSGTVAG